MTYFTERKFQIILMTGNAFQVFLNQESIETLMQNVSRWLKLGGLFVFDTRIEPDADSGVESWPPYTNHMGHHVKVRGKSTFDQGTGLQSHWMERIYPDGSKRPTAIELKFTPVAQITQLLQAVGLVAVEVFGDWKKSAPNVKSAVITARKALP